MTISTKRPEFSSNPIKSAPAPCIKDLDVEPNFWNAWTGFKNFPTPTNPVANCDTPLTNPPTAVSGASISGSSNSGVVYDFLTGSYFQPYVTTVGLYNNANQLVAVGKLSQPLQSSNVTDTTILVNLDL